MAGSGEEPGRMAQAILEELLRLMRDRQSRPANAPTEKEGHAIADYQVLSSLLRGTRDAKATRLDSTEFTYDKSKQMITLEESFGGATADVHRRLKSPRDGVPTDIVRLNVDRDKKIATPDDTVKVLRVDLLGPDGEVKGWAHPKK